MQAFIQKYRSVVTGTLSGFDRLLFRGTLRNLCYVEGMMGFLGGLGILLKDFGAYVQKVTDRVKLASLAVAENAGRPVVYLESPRTRKDEAARKILDRDGVRDGLVCVFKTVEPCRTFDIFRNREKKRLELRLRDRKCLHLYHYLIHPRFGLMHVRLQTWFPFSIQVWVNGREWLSRELDRAGLAYCKRDNAIVWCENGARAQAMLDRQLRVAWPKLLDELVERVHPAHPELAPNWSMNYYWSVAQSEWATDVLFRSPAQLAAIYPHLVAHGIKHFGSADVLRFLGRRVNASGSIPARFSGEVISDLRERPEGLRIKHRVNRNSIKLYDKQGSVLRVETTIDQPAEFKVFRPKGADEEGAPGWHPLRRGIADLHRRAQVSQAANDRYLDALASVEQKTPLSALVDRVCRPVTDAGRRFRALNPWAPADAEVLTAIQRGEFLVNGLRNRDLRAVLFPKETMDPAEARRRTGQVTRWLRLLRAHGLIAKVPRTHRYMVTLRGRQTITAIVAARHANAESLTQNAA